MNIGQRVRVIEGGKNIPTGTIGTITESGWQDELFGADFERVMMHRVHFPGNAHGWGGVMGVWGDEPSLEAAAGPLDGDWTYNWQSGSWARGGEQAGERA